MQQVYLGLHASSVRSVHNLCCGSPRYGCGCGCAACGVWVLMAARRKQSGNNSNNNSKSNCKSHASKYSAVAVCTAENKLNNYDKNGSKLCVCCGSFKRVDDFCARIGTQQPEQANVQCATRNVPHAAGNGRRCGINQINGNCLKFALVYGLHGAAVSLPMLIAMECPHTEMQMLVICVGCMQLFLLPLPSYLLLIMSELGEN